MKNKPHWIIPGLVIAAGMFYVLMLRPSGVTEGSLRDSYRTHEKAYHAVAEYLVQKKISTSIGGLLTPDCNYGIKGEQTRAYSDFIDGITEFMADDSYQIISDGKTVEFVPPVTGGILTRKRGAVVYSGKNSPDGEEVVKLTNDGWYITLS